MAAVIPNLFDKVETLLGLEPIRQLLQTCYIAVNTRFQAGGKCCSSLNGFLWIRYRISPLALRPSPQSCAQ